MQQGPNLHWRTARGRSHMTSWCQTHRLVLIVISCPIKIIDMLTTTARPWTANRSTISTTCKISIKRNTTISRTYLKIQTKMMINQMGESSKTSVDSQMLFHSWATKSRKCWEEIRQTNTFNQFPPNTIQTGIKIKCHKDSCHHMAATKI